MYRCCDNTFPTYANHVIVYNNSSSDLAVRVTFPNVNRQTFTIGANDCKTFSTPNAYNLTDVRVEFGADEDNFDCFVEFDHNCV